MTSTSSRPATAPRTAPARTWGYARVSTPDQSIDGQVDALTAAGADRVWSDVASGASASIDRPGLAALLEHTRPGDVVTAVRLDRLGRSLPELVALLADLDARGVTVRTADGVDTATAGGRVLAGLWAVLAAAEREWIRDRTRAGLAAARARGRVGGRPPAMTPARREAAATLRANGASLAEIAHALGVGKTTVRRHLSSPELAPPPSAVVGAGAGLDGVSMRTDSTHRPDGA